MQELKPKLLPFVLESFGKLKDEAEIVLVEGAGSASEINLRKNDIANMGFARAADVPVVIVGDIDRGGVIASLVGTKAVLDPDDAKLVEGFIVNRMRGDISLFADGMKEIASRTGWAPLGLVPFFDGARRLPAEDAYDLTAIGRPRGTGGIKVVVPLLPHIANFDDLDPLASDAAVDLIMVERGRPLPHLRSRGVAGIESDHRGSRDDARAKVGTSISPRMCGMAGACSGCAADIRCSARPSPTRTASRASLARWPGLACSMSRRRSPERRRWKTSRASLFRDGVPVRGYEMHMGRTTGPGTDRP